MAAAGGYELPQAGVVSSTRRADAELVTWRDRDWARFNDQERKQLYGSSPARPFTSDTRSRDTGHPVHHVVRKGRSLRLLVWALVAVALGFVSGFVHDATSHAGRSGYAGLPVISGPPPVYGGPVVSSDGYAFACTAQLLDVDKWVCAEWRALVPGQVAQSAVDTGEPCGYRHADQASGKWSCDQVTRPRDVVPMPSPPFPQRAPEPAPAGSAPWA